MSANFKQESNLHIFIEKEKLNLVPISQYDETNPNDLKILLEIEKKGFDGVIMRDFYETEKISSAIQA